MCGIAGVMHSDPDKPIVPQIMATMPAIQWHRVPEGVGVKAINYRGIRSE